MNLMHQNKDAESAYFYKGLSFSLKETHQDMPCKNLFTKQHLHIHQRQA